MKKLIVSLAIFALSINAFAQDVDDRRIMEMMNQLRKEQDVKPLKFHPKLDSIADSWVKYIANELNVISDEQVHKNQKENPKYLHIDFEQRALLASLTKGISIISISENVAFSSGAFPEDLSKASFIAWKNSLPHYEVIVNKNNSHFAFSSIKCSNGRVVYLTVFAHLVQ